MQVYWWFLQYLKVEREAEPSAIRLLSCGTISQIRSEGQTPSLCLRVGLKLSFLTKLIVRSDLTRLGSALSYAAIGLDCRGTSFDTLSSSFSSFPSPCILLLLMQVTNFTSSPEFFVLSDPQEAP